MARGKWFNREVFGWAMFDFANQAFTLVILTTMFHLYFVRYIVAGDEARGRQLWATSGIAALIVVVVISPLIGALADFSGAKKRLLLVTYLGCVALTASLALVPPGAVAFGMAVFIAGYIFYAVGENFMAAFLPELASPRDMGKVSAFGWTLGYMGGLTCLAGAAAIAAVFSDDEVLGYRLICLWAAAFFFVAALPTFILVRERKQRETMPPGQSMWTIGFRRLADTLRSMRDYRHLFRFLGIMTFYMAGMSIVIWFAGSIATKLFGIPPEQLPLFILLLTVMAIAGAICTGRFQDRIGTRLTINLALCLWLAVMIGAAFVPEQRPGAPPPPKLMFWLLGSGVGFGMGMLGTSSRAMVGLFSPPHKAAEFFGFYGLGTKIAAIIGLLMSVVAEELFAGHYNLAVASSGVFFVGGLALMTRVDERAGRIAAARAARAHVRAHRDYAGTLLVNEQNAVATDDAGASGAAAGAPVSADASVGADGATASGAGSAAGSAAGSPTGSAAGSATDGATGSAAGSATGSAPSSSRTSAAPATTHSEDARMIYLDSNSTSRPSPEVVDAMRTALADDWANPSSAHRAGQAARKRIELARHAVCGLIGCADRELLFTSGGTEAANLALLGSLTAQPRRRVLVTSRLEHSAVRELAEHLADRGTEVVWLDNDADGIVDVDQLADVLGTRGSEIALVSIMWVNNETGVVQDVARIAALCAEHGVRVHTDATQAVGKLPCDLARLPVDLLSFSAHKFHGPKGTGALFVRSGVKLVQQQVGGPQERHRRGGTENVAGIAGMGAAAESAAAWLGGDGPARCAARRDRFEARLRAAVPGATVNGRGAPRVWSTSNVALPDVEAEPVLLLLSERGVYASAGAACSSGSVEASSILRAMGVEEARALGSIRFSFSRETTDAEVDAAIDVIGEVVTALRA